MVPKTVVGIVITTLFLLMIYYTCFLRYTIKDFEDVEVNFRKENLSTLPVPEDIFLISSYYYPTSESLGDNAVALVFTTHYGNSGLSIRLLGINETDNAVSVAKFQRIVPHNICNWISLFTTVQLVPNMKSLNLFLGDSYYQLPFKTVSYEKKDVVTCISPLFASEAWQNLVLAAHLYKKFGSFMHVYVRSMVASVYNVMMEYEKAGYLKMEPWTRVTLSTVPESAFNPNINVEFRNQAASQTDCLLKYKESATFISFMDLDDILIPRLGDTYIEEYNILFNLENFLEKERNRRVLRKNWRENKMDSIINMAKEKFWRKEEREKIKEIAFLHYKKENIHVAAHYDPKKFSINQMISTMYFTKQNETGKMVTRPRSFNHTWIHWPTVLPKHTKRYDIPVSMNSITHLKVVDEDRNAVTKEIKEPTYIGRLKSAKPLLSQSVISSMQDELEKMISSSKMKVLWDKLPREFFYLNIISRCFNQTYYRFHYSNLIGHIKCPGPDRCRLPVKPGIMCANAGGDFFSSTRGTTFNLHFAKSTRFDIQDGCIP